MIRKLTKSTVNTLLAPFDLQIQRCNGPMVPLEVHQSVIQELYECHRTHVFPNLPPPGRRTTLLASTGGGISRHVYVIEYLRRSLAVDGAVCEFGVALGSTSALMANEILKSDRELWLFDSFRGLSKPTHKDVLIDDIFGLGSMDAYAGAMACPEEAVRSRLASVAFPSARTRIVAGYIEETSQRTELPDRVAFAYVDFDLYEPILTALELLKDRVPVGGHVIVDDYNFFSSGGKTAVDEFAAANAPCFQLAIPPPCAGHIAILHRQSPVG